MSRARVNPVVLACALLLGGASTASAAGLGLQADISHGALAGDGLAQRIIRSLGNRFGIASLAEGSRRDSFQIDPSDDSDDDADDEAPEAPTPPIPPPGSRFKFAPKVPPVPGLGPLFQSKGDEASTRAREAKLDEELPRFTEKAKGVRAVDVLNRISSAAGWTLTVVPGSGVGDAEIDLDLTKAGIHEALRTVLRESHAKAVLNHTRTQGRLIVLPASQEDEGVLIEAFRENRRSAARGARHDIVKLFDDVVISRGSVVDGDVVALAGSIELEPGAVVKGSAVSLLGDVDVAPGALVTKESVALLGHLNVSQGAQVLGEQLQVRPSSLLHGRRSSWLSRLGPFGLFPTLALFALLYLIGLGALRFAPARLYAVGSSLFESPWRSFFVGFLCWLLLLPLTLLLCVSVIGIPLVPLLPVALFLGIALGLGSLALRVGEAMPAGPGERFVPPAALGMGMGLLLLLTFLPWLGTSLLALLQFFAVGAAVRSRFGRATAAA